MTATADALVRAPSERIPLAVLNVWATVAGVLSGGCLIRFGFDERGVVASVFVIVLVALAAIDIDRRIIPNRIVLPAAVCLLALQSAFSPGRAAEYALAGLAAALFLLLPLLVYPSGMGMGDVKLALLLGFVLGRNVGIALFVGVLLAAAVSLALIAFHGVIARKVAFAFGPFLSLGALVALFLAPPA